jgi:hypothetical protein
MYVSVSKLRWTDLGRNSPFFTDPDVVTLKAGLETSECKTNAVIDIEPRKASDTWSERLYLPNNRPVKVHDDVSKLLATGKQKVVRLNGMVGTAVILQHTCGTIELFTLIQAQVLYCSFVTLSINDYGKKPSDDGRKKKLSISVVAEFISELFNFKYNTLTTYLSTTYVSYVHEVSAKQQQAVNSLRHLFKKVPEAVAPKVRFHILILLFRFISFFNTFIASLSIG